MSITYEDIKRANDSIKTTPIKGKNYAEVNQRIKAFRMLYPQGYIITELKSNENGVCIFTALVGYTDENNEDHTLATGTAYEKEGSTFINETSYIENCETSAVGRALGMAGIGIDTSVASYEEVSNAMANQKEAPSERKATPKQIEVLKRAGAEAELLKKYGITALEDMTLVNASKEISVLKGGN